MYRSRLRRFVLVLCSGIVVGALVAWTRSLETIDLSRMNDLGLVSVLPPSFYAALVLLTLSFVLLLRQRPLPMSLLGGHVVLLVVMAYGVTTLVEEVPRLNVAWRHAGIIDHIMQKQDVDPRIDAYFNWPGFFLLGALITRLAGLDNAIALAGWASVFFNVLFLVPVVMILRAATTDERLVWLGAWFFALTNWVNQDYFAPQALAYFLHLVIVAILVTWFRPARDGDRQPSAVGRRAARFLRRPEDDDAPSRAQPLPKLAGKSFNQAALVVVVALLFAFIVPTHQLTPFATIAAVAALVAFGQCRLRGLYLLMTVMTVAWITFMAEAFLAGRIETLLAAVGDVSANTAANVGERLQGTPEHLIVVRARLVMTGAVWVLALLGGLERWRRGKPDLAFRLLALAPFPLIGLQSYGGEMLLRVYLFALPFVAMFVAAFFFPSSAVRTSWWRTMATATASLILLAGFLVSRYGNERINQFTREEVHAIDVVYRLAPRGALLLAGTTNLPWKYRHYDDYDYTTLQRVVEQQGRRAPTLVDVRSVMAGRPPSCVFYIGSRSQAAYVEALGVWPPGSLGTLEADLVASGLFRPLYSNKDARIFQATVDVGHESQASASAGAVAAPRRSIECGR